MPRRRRTTRTLRICVSVVTLAASARGWMTAIIAMTGRTDELVYDLYRTVVIGQSIQRQD